MLDKKASLYDRDEKGNLLPIEVKLEVNEEDEQQLEFKNQTIKVTPIPRGKIKRLFANVKEEQDLDGEIILEHCAEPSYTKEELVHLKPILASVIVNTIFRESGLAIGKNKKKVVEEAEDEFAKNLIGSEKTEKKAI